MSDLNMNNETMSTLPVTVKSHDIEDGFPNSTTSENSELCASPSSDNRFFSKEQLSVTDDEQSADDSASGSSVSSSHVFCRKRNAQQALPEEEDESSCSSCKDGPSPTALPDYCRTLRITDAHGHVRELVFPRGLDLDRPKRARTTFSTEQLDQLEREFVRNPYLVGQERTQLSHKLQLSETQVKVWFQNRRTKQKREQQRACDLRQLSAEGVAASNVLRLLQEQTPFRFAPSVSTMQKGNPFLSLPPFTT